MRRYIGLDVFKRCRLVLPPSDAADTHTEEVTTPALSAKYHPI